MVKIKIKTKTKTKKRNKKKQNKQTKKKFHFPSVQKGSLPFKCFIVVNLNSGSPKLVINRKGRKKMTTTLKLIAGQLLNRYASVGRAPNGNGGVTGSKPAKDPFGSGFISQSGP